jgi:hypothetical protein
LSPESNVMRGSSGSNVMRGSSNWSMSNLVALLT